MTAAPIVLTEQYVRVECDLKDDAGNLLYPGFWIEVRKNLTMGERIVLVDAISAIDDDLEGQIDALTDQAADLDERITALEASDIPDLEKRQARRLLREEQKTVLRTQKVAIDDVWNRRRALITPYIRAWNLHKADHTPLPPPVEGGTDVLVDVYMDLLSWMIRTCSQAYTMGKGLGTTTESGKSQVPTQEQTNAGPQVAKASSSRASRKKS